jgi:hypothetical protein
MGQFSKKDFGARYNLMGDWAEAACDRVFPKSAPFGFNRPPFSIQQIPVRLRYAPDRITPREFLEVKGVGRDGLIKIKHEDLSCLLWWDDLFPVEIFVYDSHRNRWAVVSIKDIQAWASAGELEMDRFQEATAEEPEGRAFWKIPVSYLDWSTMPSDFDREQVAA